MAAMTPRLCRKLTAIHAHRAPLRGTAPHRRDGPGRVYHRGRSLARGDRIVRARAGRSRRGRDRAGRALQRSRRRRPGDSARQRTRPARGDDACRRARSGRLDPRAKAMCRWCCSAITIPSCRWAWSNSRDAPPAAGADGVLITDLTPEEAGEYRRSDVARTARHDFPGRAHFHRRAPGAYRRSAPAAFFT